MKQSTQQYRPLNIAILVETVFPPVSRANLRMYRLGLTLAARGHHVYVLAPNLSPHVQRTVHRNILAIRYPGLAAFLYRRFLRLFVRVFHIVVSTVYLQRLNRKIRLDAVHAWNPIAGLASVIGGKISGCKVFTDLTDFYSDIARFESILLVPIFRFMERTILMHSDAVFTVSEEMQEACSNIYPAGDKIRIVPDGVDTRMFDPEADGKRVRRKYGLGESPVVIFHGDVKPSDGVDVLVRAFPSVLRRIPDVKLLVVGGEGEFLERIKNLVNKLRIESSVVFTGWVPHTEVPEYIAASNVGVMPLLSTLLTNCYLSFKLFEYWASEKPVIVSKVQAISKIAPDRICSLQVAPEDVEALSDAIVEVLRDKDLAALLGRNGRKAVEERFDWDILMNHEVNLCERFFYTTRNKES